MRKRCAKCGIIKEDYEFDKMKNGPKGLQGYCKNCHNDRERKAYRHEHFVKNRDKYREQARRAMRTYRLRKRGLNA